jgi:hypothetical protein
MTTLTLELETNETVAAAFRNTQFADKTRLNAYLHLLLEKYILREKARLDMFSTLEKLHDEAESNGLTDDIIEELLADES